MKKITWRDRSRSGTTSLLVATLLLGFCAEHAPWRLMGLVAESMVLRAGNDRVITGTNRYWDEQDLELRLNMLGWSVEYIPLKERGFFGRTEFRGFGRKIFIDNSLSWNARYSVLAHEGAHGLQPLRMTEQQSEAFAEDVSALVCHDGFREHARYLASMRQDALLTALVYWREMYHAASVLQGE